MAEARYPRDLHGYGRNPPDPGWPGGARIAVQVRGQFRRRGGENNILHGDAASEAFLSDVLGAKPWPGQRHANIESMFEYGSRGRLLAAMADFHRAQAADRPVFGGRDRVATQSASCRRHEGSPVGTSPATVCGGFEHKDMSEAEERAEIADAIRIHTEVTGQRPLGWVHRKVVDQYGEAGDGSRGFSVFLRLLRR